MAFLNCPDAPADLVVLAPRHASLPHTLQRVKRDARGYRSVMSEMQRLRGSVYLEDGAIVPSDLTADGRHILPIDEESWHVLSLDHHGRVCACLRFLEESHARSLDELWVRHSALSRDAQLGSRFRRAVESEIARSREEGLLFGEVGGWALSKDSRCSLQAPRVLLATYALLELLGGCLGLATATLRHGSAGLLRRIGLSGVEADGQELPPYYDPQYDCEMEVLRFDSRSPRPKFSARVREFMTALETVPVMTAAPSRVPANPIWAPLAIPSLPAMPPVLPGQLLPVAS